jgi:hypothetical protein
MAEWIVIATVSAICGKFSNGAAAYKPDVAFLPVSRMTYEYRWGGVNEFCRYLDRGLLGRSFQYTAGSDFAAELAAISGTRYAVPYATFTFSRFAAELEEIRFGASLGRHSRAKSFYPLRPMDSLTPADLCDGARSSMRRRTLAAWRRVAAASTRAKRTRLAIRIRAALRDHADGCMRNGNIRKALKRHFRRMQFHDKIMAFAGFANPRSEGNCHVEMDQSSISRNRFGGGIRVNRHDGGAAGVRADDG